MRSSRLACAALGSILMVLGGCAAAGPGPEGGASASAAVVKPPAAPAAPAPAPGRSFPSLVTKDLNGAAQRVPEGLPGELKLFLIAYQREQQADIDPWLTLALRLEGAHPGFRVYELPTLSAKWGAVSGFIDDGMRRGIPDPRARARTLTLYLDTDRFNQALALPGTDQVYALLVDAAGEVVWRGAGQLDDPAADLLTTEVRRRLGG